MAGWLALRAESSRGSSGSTPRAEPRAVGLARMQPAAGAAGQEGGADISPTRPNVTSPRSPSTLRRLLGNAERDLAAAVARRDAAIGALSSAGNDHIELARRGAEVAVAEEALAGAEERWLELAGEAESAGLTM